jgi:hypothetical protein
MRLSEDGPTCGPKHAATIKQNQREQFDWFIFYQLLCWRPNTINHDTRQDANSEDWSLTLREGHRLRMSENRVLRIFGPKRKKWWGIEKSCIMMCLISDRQKWDSHIGHTGDNRIAKLVTKLHTPTEEENWDAQGKVGEFNWRFVSLIREEEEERKRKEKEGGGGGSQIK